MAVCGRACFLRFVSDFHRYIWVKIRRTTTITASLKKLKRIDRLNYVQFGWIEYKSHMNDKHI